jgi:hypothetical protein
LIAEEKQQENKWLTLLENNTSLHKALDICDMSGRIHQIKLSFFFPNISSTQIFPTLCVPGQQQDGHQSVLVTLGCHDLLF